MRGELISICSEIILHTKNVQVCTKYHTRCTFIPLCTGVDLRVVSCVWRHALLIDGKEPPPFP